MFTSSTISDGATGSPIFSIVSLNISRSSAFLIVRAVVPIRRTLFAFKIPASSSSIARFKPACPPRVGRTLSGFSFLINCSTTSVVSGSIYTRSAISLSVMIVAGLEFKRTTSMPSSFKERQACVPALSNSAAWPITIGPEPITSTFLISGFLGIIFPPPSCVKSGQTDIRNPAVPGMLPGGTGR